MAEEQPGSSKVFLSPERHPYPLQQWTGKEADPHTPSFLHSPWWKEFAKGILESGIRLVERPPFSSSWDVFKHDQRKLPHAKGRWGEGTTRRLGDSDVVAELRYWTGQGEGRDQGLQVLDVIEYEDLDVGMKRRVRPLLPIETVIALGPVWEKLCERPSTRTRTADYFKKLKRARVLLPDHVVQLSSAFGRMARGNASLARPFMTQASKAKGGEFKREHFIRLVDYYLARADTTGRRENVKMYQLRFPNTSPKPPLLPLPPTVIDKMIVGTLNEECEATLVAFAENFGININESHRFLLEGLSPSEHRFLRLVMRKYRDDPRRFFHGLAQGNLTAEIHKRGAARERAEIRPHLYLIASPRSGYSIRRRIDKTKADLWRMLAKGGLVELEPFLTARRTDGKRVLFDDTHPIATYDPKNGSEMVDVTTRDCGPSLDKLLSFARYPETHPFLLDIIDRVLHLANVFVRIGYHHSLKAGNITVEWWKRGYYDANVDNLNEAYDPFQVTSDPFRAMSEPGEWIAVPRIIDLERFSRDVNLNKPLQNLVVEPVWVPDG